MNLKIMLDMTLAESREINRSLEEAIKLLTTSDKSYSANLLSQLKESIEDEVRVYLDKIEANFASSDEDESYEDEGEDEDEE